MEMNGTNILWFLAFVLLAGGGLGGFFGNNRPIGPAPASIEDVNNAINNQSIQQQLSALGVETANNNYETAMLLNQQNNLMQQQNNTNLLTAVNGFNALTQQIQAYQAQVQQQISQLGYQMDRCCCEIKTQGLEFRLADAEAENIKLTNKLDNAQQTQTILGNLGRFVAWAGSGSQAAAVSAG